jgi:pantothenate kinase-related protein Tda10
MNEDITVTVSGPAGAGKSAIARVIELALYSHGVCVNRVDDNGTGIKDEREGVIELSVGSRMVAVAERGATVTVQTRLLRK